MLKKNDMTKMRPAKSGRFFRWIMEKTNKQKLKDYTRNKGKIWVDEPQTLKKRTCSGGVRFGGSYVDKRVGK